jgi:hypothetical protein
LKFSAKTSTSNEWKAVISAISTLVEEATFEATVEGISFRGMDPSHVALIDISWPNSAFEKYNCDSDVKFGVRVDEFSKLIKRAGKDESVEINISEDNMLLISIGKNKKYKMRLIESSDSDTPIPKIPYDSKIGLTSTTFDKILGDIEVVVKPIFESYGIFGMGVSESELSINLILYFLFFPIDISNILSSEMLISTLSSFPALLISLENSSTRTPNFTSLSQLYFSNAELGQEISINAT